MATAHYLEILMYLAGFLIIAVASRHIAKSFINYKLPLITGLLITGIIAGPFVLQLIPEQAIVKLNFVNETALAYIAFAAGAELYLKELRMRLNSIGWNTIGQLVATFCLGSIAVYLLFEMLPFMGEMDMKSKIAVSILAGTIFVARSPSSAIAVIYELRAKGPFTQTTLGVTVFIDFLVIILFSICFSIAGVLIMDYDFGFSIILFLLLELLLSGSLGYLVSKGISFILSIKTSHKLKGALILLLGYSTYVFSHLVGELTTLYLDFDLHLEPLLICIIASFLITNYSNHRIEFSKFLNDTGIFIYVAFFTLTGASLSIDIISEVWAISLILFLVRLISLMIGAYFGATMAKDPAEFKKFGWMSYVTQAGVSIGLATQVASEYSIWGAEFATIMIAVIVLNQVVGPPLIKWALIWVGEGHTKGTPGAEMNHGAIIFGLENQSIALARQLQEHGWSVKIATRKPNVTQSEARDVDIRLINGLNKEAMDQLDAPKASAIITMLTDEENLQVAEIAYEEYGTKDLVVRLNDRANFDRFHQLGALIVEPATAIVGLLDHFVRSPAATSLLLGMEKDQDTIDLEVQNPALHGMALRDLHLPTDIIILSMKRGGQMLISHGYTRLRIGDIITVVGSVESLEKVRLRIG